jgi:hypothetical protein
VAVFRNGDLVEVQIRHWFTRGCDRPRSYLDPRTWLRTRTGEGAKNV